MNKTLAILFFEDYLVCAVEPFNGKFEHLKLNDELNFPFYFFIDNINQRIDYSFAYKVDYQDQKENYIGDLITGITQSGKTYQWYDYQSEYISLFSNIIKDIKNEYLEIMKKYDNSIQLGEGDQIATNYIFSDNIIPEAKEKIIAYFSKNGLKLNEQFKFDTSIVEYHINKIQRRVIDKKYAVIETIGSHLNMSIVECKNNKYKRIHFQQFEDYGTDPRIQVIAKKIVDDVNRQEGLLAQAEDIKKEYLRHQTKAGKIVKALKNIKKPYLRIETTFAVDPNRKIVTNLSLEEIDKLSYLHARQFSSFFTDHFLSKAKLKTLDIEKVFLVGNTLNNELITAEFERFGNDKLEYYSDEIGFVLKEALKEQQDEVEEEDEEATMFMVSEAVEKDFETKTSKRELESLRIQELQIGQKVRLNNFDSTPGKGESVQELEYIGDNKFIIRHSTRSLLSGDEATSITTVWMPKIQIDFDIKRNGKTLGRFRTRPVVKIELL